MKLNTEQTMAQQINEDDPGGWTDNELYEYLVNIGRIDDTEESIDDYFRLELIKLVKADLGIE